MIDVEIKCTCQDCDKEFDEYSVNIQCEECSEKITQEEIKRCVVEVSKKSYLWKSKDCYTGFESEKDLETYLTGLRRGYENALFWLCDHFGLVEFYEKEIELENCGWRNIVKKSET